MLRKTPGPNLTAFLCGLYFFLAMASYYILKPVRESYFVHTQGYMNLPKVHLIVGLITLFAAQGYAALARRFSADRLVGWTNAFFVVCILGFWVLLPREPGAAGVFDFRPWAYYIWVAIFAVFVVTVFWSLTNSLFTTEEGTRRYGYIGAGGILGGSFGGIVTGLLAKRYGSINLLPISAMFLLPCIFIGKWLATNRRPKNDGTDSRHAPASQHSIYGIFRTNSYACAMGLLVVLMMAVADLQDHQAQIILHRSVPDSDQRTAFFGKVYSGANLLGLMVGVFLTAPLFSRFGPLPGLISMPLAVGVEALTLILHPTLSVISCGFIVELGMQYSIFQTAKELLYVPTSSEVKYVAKAFIDTFLFRLGLATGAAWIVLFPPNNSIPNVSCRILPLVASAVLTASWLASRHRRLVATQPA